MRSHCSGSAAAVEGLFRQPCKDTVAIINPTNAKKHGRVSRDLVGHLEIFKCGNILFLGLVNRLFFKDLHSDGESKMFSSDTPIVLITVSCCVLSQEFGLARFKSNQAKAMKGLEYAMSNLQGKYAAFELQMWAKESVTPY